MCVFVLARKQPITPVPLYQQTNNPQCYNTSSSSVTDEKKIRPFDVENLIQKTEFYETQSNVNTTEENKDIEISKNVINVNDNIDKINTTTTKVEIKQDEEDCITLYPGVKINNEIVSNNNVCQDIKAEHAQQELNELKIPTSEPNAIAASKTNTNLDRSAEIKHAQTPINTTIQQSHSPQLPVSSPSYPVQTFLSSDFDCSKITIVESNTNYDKPNFSSFENPDTNQNLATQTNTTQSNFENKSTIHIPNVSLLTTSNNFDASEANQTMCKNGVSFWDLHLPYSTASISTVEVKERESLNNITIKDLLSNNKKLNKDAVSDKDRHDADEDKRTAKKNRNCIENNGSTCIVLNVPLIHAHQPPQKKQKLSKIDVATRKRKERRERHSLKRSLADQENIKVKIKKERIVFERITTHKGTVTDFGLPVFGYSDSESSSSYTSSEYESDTAEIDFSNLPHLSTQPHISREKLNFLQLFGLITYRKKNAVELSKLERRKWQPKWTPIIENPVNSTLDLPVPSVEPSELSISHKNPSKVNFLHVLGLQKFPSQRSYDYEMDWLKVIEERTKRNCTSAITDYTLKVHNAFVKSISSNEKAQIPCDPILQLRNNYLQKECRKYSKYLKKPLRMYKNETIFKNSLENINIPVLHDSNSRNLFNNFKNEGIFKDKIIVPTVYRKMQTQKLYHDLSTSLKDKNEVHRSYSSYAEDGRERNLYKRKTYNEHRFILKNSKPTTPKYCVSNSSEEFSLQTFNKINDCDSKSELKNELFLKNGLCENIKVENGYECKRYNSLLESNKANLKSSNMFVSKDLSKDFKSTCIQTESNYVLPLTMILVDNRAIQQGTFNDQVSNTLRNNMQSKSVQCLIQEDLVNSISNTSSCLLLNNSKDVIKWPGIHKIVESYHLYSKECGSEIKSLKESLKILKEAILSNQTEARNLERDRRLLQSASLLYEQDRMQLQKEIDNFNITINAFR